MAQPTIEGSNNDAFPLHDPKVTGDELTIVNALEGYRLEADQARKGGLNPRDQKWRENLNLYWGRHDFSRKANWQAREVMPEVSSYVDRFAAAMKEALISTPEGFYTVSDPADEENDIADTIKRMTDVWLSRAGRNQMGSLLGFSSVFEEQMKLGALMATSSVVTWKGDVENGRVAVETVDPRFVWLDHTYRNLYRARRIELDRYDLYQMVKAKDAKGKAIFNLPQIEQLIGSLNQDAMIKTELSGHGQQVNTGRSPVILDEYIATVLDERGEVLADKSLMVVANQRFLIRGPEKNPFWHGTDWLTFAPLVTTPLSVYGRSYMEDFASVAKTFNELTNMILDAVHTSSLKAYAIVPGMLLNPQQAAEGLSPNKLFLLEEGFRAEDFAKALDLGQLPPESVKVWQAMKSELGEAASINEIGLGQFAPNSRTSATEIDQTQQSSSALIRSIAQTVETRYLDPTLDLVWKTGLQHVSKKDKVLMSAGGDMFQALVSRRRELIERPITFQARGITMMIQKSNMLKTILGLVQVMGQNQLLAQEFMKEIDVGKLVHLLFNLSGVDLSKLQLSQREQMIKSIAQPLQDAQNTATGAAPPNGAQQPQQPPAQQHGQNASAAMQGLAKSMGILRKGHQGPPTQPGMGQ